METKLTKFEKKYGILSGEEKTEYFEIVLSKGDQYHGFEIKSDAKIENLYEIFKDIKLID